MIRRKKYKHAEVVYCYCPFFATGAYGRNKFTAAVLCLEYTLRTIPYRLIPRRYKGSGWIIDNWCKDFNLGRFRLRVDAAGIKLQMHDGYEPPCYYTLETFLWRPSYPTYPDFPIELLKPCPAPFSFFCCVCGIPTDTAPRPPDKTVCPDHCEDHEYKYVREERRHECKYCGQEAPPDWYADWYEE